VIAFGAASAALALTGYALAARGAVDRRKTAARLRSIGGGPALKQEGWTFVALPSLQAFSTLTTKNRVVELRMKLLQAGYRRASAPMIFIAIRVLLVLAVVLGGASAGLIAGWSWKKNAFVAFTSGAAAMIAPGIWLGSRVKSRQQLLRNALPDALDMLVLCLEGGAGFSAAMQKVTDELNVVHPILGLEMNIIQREIQLGLSAGESLMKFADRCGLADVRDLAMVISQSERFGASLTKALRNFTEAARHDRQQQAEERAQKAAVKILFPTLVCIFPAIFIVILGPAAFQMAKMFSR
jgi:tight adherence protein C